MVIWSSSHLIVMFNYANVTNFNLPNYLWKGIPYFSLVFKNSFSFTVEGCLDSSKSLWFYTYSWYPNISIFDTYKCFNRYMDSNLVWLKCNNQAHLSRLTRFHFLMIFYCKFIWFPLIYCLISHRLFFWENMNNFVWNYEGLA